MLSLRSLIYLWYTLVLTTLPFIVRKLGHGLRIKWVNSCESLSYVLCCQGFFLGQWYRVRQCLFTCSLLHVPGASEISIVLEMLFEGLEVANIKRL